MLSSLIGPNRGPLLRPEASEQAGSHEFVPNRTELEQFDLYPKVQTSM